MELSIAKVILGESIVGDGLFMKHALAKFRTVRIMLWTHLIRDRRFTYNDIAKRFGCTRRNVIWSVRSFEGAMESSRSVRESYSSFKKRAGLTDSPTPLRI